MKTRDEFGKLLTKRGCRRVAEIGVLRGGFSARILSDWDGELVLVDAWRHLEDYRDIANVSPEQHEENLEATRAAVAGRPGVEIVRAVSTEAAAQFEEGYFDAVYIDANHSYKAVLADLAAWVPKVCPGGIVAGHDFLDGSLPEGDFGVRSAVVEFFGCEPDIVTDEKWPTWVVFL